MQETGLQRERIIVRTSIAGIAVNILLSAAKAAIGLLSHSISVVLDALNNLSDALSSIITIVGTKLALRPASKKHPFGHGRTEYLAALIIAVIILYVGVSSIRESIRVIISRELPQYDTPGIILLTVAVFVKIALGLFVKKQGKRTNSTSLVASGQDALLDSIVSASTVAAAVIFLTTGKSLEAWLGLVIAALIIKSGIELILETTGDLLGKRIDSTLSKQIKETVAQSDPEISGAYDLVLNNYGPDTYLGSVHIEVPYNWTAAKIDEVTRIIQRNVLERHSVLISTVGIYLVNSDDPEVSRIRSDIESVLQDYPDIIQMHGFHADLASRHITFDIIISFDAKERDDCYRRFRSDIESRFPGYTLAIQTDADISD